MRLIDADALNIKFKKYRELFVDGWGGFSSLPPSDKARVDELDNCIAQVINAKTIDAVPVVRCKDCDISQKSFAWGDGWRFCENNNQHHKDDHFCSYGKRKDGDGNG